MPIVEVNGQEIEFPDDMQPEAIKEVLRSKFPPPAQQVVPQPQAEQEASALQKLTQPLTNVSNQTADIIRNIGNQNPLSSALQLGSQGANLAALPVSIMAEFEKKPAQNIAAGLNETVLGRFLGDKLLGAKESFSPITQPLSEFAQTNPELSKDVGALANIGLTLAGGKTATAVSPTIAKPIANKIENSAFVKATESGVAPIKTAEELNSAASALYDSAEKLGGAIKPEGTSQIVENILKKVEPQTETLKQAAKNIRGAANPVDDAINMVSGLRGKSLTLNELDGIDGLLQEKISANITDKATVRQLKTIQNEFRNASANVSAENLVNPEAFDAWRSGDALYSAKMKVQQIDDIVKNAYNQQVPSTGIKTGFRQLAKSIDKYGSQGWTPEEIKAIRNAAKSGVIGGTIQALGGRLTGTIAGAAAGVGSGGVGSFIGVPAGLAASYPLRAAGNALQKGRAAQVQRLVGERPVVKSNLQKTSDKFRK